MVKNVSSDKSDIGSWLNWFWGLRSTFEDFQFYGVLLELFAESIAKLQGIHEIFTVSQTFSCSFQSLHVFKFDNFVFWKRVDLVFFSQIDLGIFVLCVLKHGLVFQLILLLYQEGLLLSLPPHSDRLVRTRRHKKVPNATRLNWPNLSEKSVPHKDLIILVSIPVFDFPVLATAEEVMGWLDELDTSDRILMGENGLMDVSEIQAPDFDVLVCGAGD